MSHFISLQQAIDMTSTYRDNRNQILAEEYRNQDILAVCETFDRAELEDVLKQTDCQALRIYFGMDENMKVHAILVGVNSNDEDILTEGDELIMDTGTRCPIDCPPESPLNG